MGGGGRGEEKKTGWEGGERGEEKKTGWEGGGHPSEMECMQRILKGGHEERGQFSYKNKSVCRLSHLQSKQPSEHGCLFLYL